MKDEKMIGRQNIRNGFMMTELIVAMSMLGVLLFIFVVSMNGFKRLNHYQLVKQHCISAAQATLDNIAVSGTAIDDNDFHRLFPDVSIQIEKSQGQGQWKGLTLITVTANAQSDNKKAQIRLSRYFLKDVRPSFAQEK